MFGGCRLLAVCMAKVPPFYFPTVQFCSLPEGSTTHEDQQRQTESKAIK